jgi:hypothetical protein
MPFGARLDGLSLVVRCGRSVRDDTPWQSTCTSAESGRAACSRKQARKQARGPLGGPPPRLELAFDDAFRRDSHRPSVPNAPPPPVFTSSGCGQPLGSVFPFSLDRSHTGKRRPS